MGRTLVWRGLDAPRMEIAHVEVDGAALRARGTQIGVDPAPYELRYELTPERLRAEVVDGASLETELDGHDFFDLAYSPLLNSLPVLGGLEAPRDFVMAFVSVPDLTVSRSEQRYEPFAPALVRFRQGDFTAMLRFDDDGFVAHYPGLAERIR